MPSAAPRYNLHMAFELFDRGGDLSIRYGNLPHWFQPGVTYFVTVRTDDSVSNELAARWRRQGTQWLLAYGIDPRTINWKIVLGQLPHGAQREFHRKFTAEFENYLDRGYGQCVLRQRPLADIVAESLLRFDGDRYHLGDFIVMPNHVHLLCCLIGKTEIESLCKSWKRFTAARINKAIGKSGRFWQKESFDHLVRSPEHFDHLRRYIADNPRRAKLRDQEFLHYCCPLKPQ
jgi:putative transposase